MKENEELCARTKYLKALKKENEELRTRTKDLDVLKKENKELRAKLAATKGKQEEMPSRPCLYF